MILYLHRPISAILLDYFTRPERAKFWAGCSYLIVFLFPLTLELVLLDRYAPTRAIGLMTILNQLKWGLIGLIVAALTVAIMVGLLARTTVSPVWVSSEKVDDLNRLLDRIRELRAKEIVNRIEHFEKMD